MSNLLLRKFICLSCFPSTLHFCNFSACYNSRTYISYPFLNFSAEPGAPDLDYVLREIYILYADCALKDPFYELEMPIRCELFSQAVDALIQRVEKGRR